MECDQIEIKDINNTNFIAEERLKLTNQCLKVFTDNLYELIEFKNKSIEGKLLETMKDSTKTIKEKTKEICNLIGAPEDARKIVASAIYLACKTINRETASKFVGFSSFPIFQFCEKYGLKKERTKKGKWTEERRDIALKEFDRISQKLNVSEGIKKKAVAIFNRYVKTKTMHGTTIGTLASVCLYYCCENNEYAIPIEYFLEITNFKNLNEKAFSQAYKEIVSTLKLSAKPKKPADYLSFFAKRINLEPFILSKIKFTMNELNNHPIFQQIQHNPKTLAVVIIHNVCRKNNYVITIKVLCDIAKISQNTFSKFEKEIVKYLN